MKIDPTARIPLGIGTLFGQSVTLLVQNFGLFFALSYGPALLGALISFVALASMMDQLQNPTNPFDIFGPAYFVATLVPLLIGLVAYALLTLVAFDRISGRPMQIRAHLGTVLRFLPPLLVLGFVYVVMVYVGLALLLLPGLYLAARYWVMAPAMLVEPAGWRALSRAAALSRSYRWSMVGGMIMLGVASIAIGLAGGALVSLLTTGSANIFAASTVPTGLMGVLAAVLNSVLTALIYALSAVFGGLLYARLREIKEGIGLESLQEVFA